MSNAYDERRIFLENMKHLVQAEYEQLFRILRNNKQSFTENSNGIFFDLMSISDHTFKEMKPFMDFCMENRKEDQSRIHELNELTTEVNTLLNTREGCILDVQ
jgi:hypothetical protein